MKRRTYLGTVGASAVTALAVGTATAGDTDDCNGPSDDPDCPLENNDDK